MGKRNRIVWTAKESIRTFPEYPSPPGLRKYQHGFRQKVAEPSPKRVIAVPADVWLPARRSPPRKDRLAADFIRHARRQEYNSVQIEHSRSQQDSSRRVSNA